MASFNWLTLFKYQLRIHVGIVREHVYICWACVSVVEIFYEFSKCCSLSYTHFIHKSKSFHLLCIFTTFIFSFSHLLAGWLSLASVMNHFSSPTEFQLRLKRTTKMKWDKTKRTPIGPLTANQSNELAFICIFEPFGLALFNVFTSVSRCIFINTSCRLDCCTFMCECVKCTHQKHYQFSSDQFNDQVTVTHFGRWVKIQTSLTQ